MNREGFVCVLTVASLAGGNLSQISVVIALHFQVEDFAFWITCFGNEEFVQKSLETRVRRETPISLGHMTRLSRRDSPALRNRFP
jgi:hypothetical protein